jgi:hypothetical protein
MLDNKVSFPTMSLFPPIFTTTKTQMKTVCILIVTGCAIVTAWNTGAPERARHEAALAEQTQLNNELDALGLSIKCNRLGKSAPECADYFEDQEYRDVMNHSN